MITRLRPCVVLGPLLAALIISSLTAAESDSSTSSIAYWSTQHKGANYFNEVPNRQWLIDARAAGIKLIRLAPNKWQSAKRDFLIGNADQFTGIVEDDFLQLLTVLNWADSLDVKVLLTTLSVPGARWKQQNGDTLDLRLWESGLYVPQAATFWREFAGRLKGHRAVVGLNILNEPVPERAHYGKHQGNPDSVASERLNAFNKAVIKAIREVDSIVPIILDCGRWADPSTITRLDPVDDPSTLYAVHMYEPFEFTNKKSNKGQFEYGRTYTREREYGGIIRIDSMCLNSDGLMRILQPVVDWQQKHRIPSSKIVLEEFGCNRTTKGAAAYLADLVTIFNRHNWHWLFYSFREDSWDGMDYELGNKPLGGKYWQARERGEHPEVSRKPNPLWEVLAGQFRD